MIRERTGYGQPLQPIEVAQIEPGFNWQTEAWFNGQVHQILRLPEQTDWVGKTGFIYQITPFVFQDATAREAQGSHFVIPESRYTNTVKLTGGGYRWRIRTVEGAGWIQSKDPGGNLFDEWIGQNISPNRVFEFSQGWTVRLTAAIGYGALIVEAIDIPKYDPNWEEIIPAGDKQSFWLP